MATEAKRLVASGIAYLFFGVFMLFMALCGWEIIQFGSSPKSTFMAVASTAIGIFDLVFGIRRLSSWGGACPSCGYSKVSIYGDATSTYCRACRRKIVRKGTGFYREQEG